MMGVDLDMSEKTNSQTKMKKILILSYHFPPMNVIASQRALGYANHLKKYGFEPTILTFDWSKPIEEQYCTVDEFEGKIQNEETENYKVIRIPVIGNKFYRFIDKQQGNLIYKLWVIWCWLSGKLDVSPRVLEFGRSERKYLQNYVNNKSFDVVLGIYSPHFHLKNCFFLHKASGIPYVLDFRDLWSNRILNKNYKPSFQFRLQDRMNSKYWKRWASKSLLLSITSKPWADKLAEVTGKYASVITNGYEPNEIESISLENNDSKELKIVHLGSIYHQQKIDMIVDALADVIEDHPDYRIKLYFVGAIREGTENSKFSFNSRVDKILSQRLTSEHFQATDRVDRAEAIKWLMKSDILLFPSFPDTPGTYSGKIFEYLMARKNILMFPSDKGVCDELIQETNAGAVCDTTEEIKQFLIQKYTEYLKNKSLRFQGNDTVRNFTRENQSKLQAKHISNVLEGVDRLIFFAPDFYPIVGGVTEYTIQLATAFNYVGKLDFLYTLQQEKCNFEFDYFYFENKVIPDTNLKNPSIIRKGQSFLRLKKRRAYLNSMFERAFNSNSPILINSLFYGESWRLINRCIETEKRFIPLIHGLDIIENRDVRPVEMETMVAKSFKIIVNSNSTKNLLCKYYPGYNSKIEIIYPPFNAAYFDSFQVSKELSCEGCSIVISSVCRLVKRKGIDLAIQAVESLKNKGLKFKYYIAGQGPEMDNLKQLIDDLQLSNEVILMGEVSEADKYNLLHQSDVFIMPNHSLKDKDIEGFGISFVEAQYFENFIIGGESGGARESVYRKNLLVDFENDVPPVDQISSKLLELIDNKISLEEVKKESRSFVLANFEISILKEKLKDLFNQNL